jgi:hypothetical protein
LTWTRYRVFHVMREHNARYKFELTSQNTRGVCLNFKQSGVEIDVILTTTLGAPPSGAFNCAHEVSTIAFWGESRGQGAEENEFVHFDAGEFPCESIFSRISMHTSCPSSTTTLERCSSTRGEWSAICKSTPQQNLAFLANYDISVRAAGRGRRCVRVTPASLNSIMICLLIYYSPEVTRALDVVEL